MHVRPAKTESFLSAWTRFGALAIHTYPVKTDQTKWLRRLIWIFLGTPAILKKILCPGSFDFVLLLFCTNISVTYLSQMLLCLKRLHNIHSMDISSTDLDSTCNSGCQCDTQKFEPVCGSDSIMYFTPCHAGCSYDYIIDQPHLNKVKLICQTCPGIATITDHSLPMTTRGRANKPLQTVHKPQTKTKRKETRAAFRSLWQFLVDGSEYPQTILKLSFRTTKMAVLLNNFFVYITGLEKCIAVPVLEPRTLVLPFRCSTDSDPRTPRSDIPLLNWEWSWISVLSRSAEISLNSLSPLHAGLETYFHILS